jgi:DNA-directed RNA polymerase specialized sigma24 family protein
VDHLRKQRKFVDLSQAEDVKMEEQATSDPDKKAAISRAILRLSEKEKVLVVAYSEGLSYKEMADLTEIRFASIGKTLARSLKKNGI